MNPGTSTYNSQPASAIHSSEFEPIRLNSTSFLSTSKQANTRMPRSGLWTLKVEASLEFGVWGLGFEVSCTRQPSFKKTLSRLPTPLACRAMKVEFYGHVRQYHNIESEIDDNIRTVLESGQYVMGPMLKKFEGELAAYHSTKYAVGLGNGTDAIWLTLMALGIGPGDEVITHANTFFATAEAIWIAGATAVFVDCEPE